MIWLAIIAAFAVYLAVVWSGCIIRGAQTRHDAPDEHAEQLGIGGASFVHDDGFIQ